MVLKFVGSLLIGRTPGDSDLLKRRVQQLSEAGLQAEYLSGHDLLQKEPALMVGEDSSAAFLPDDCQLDAQRTVAFIEKVSYFCTFNYIANIFLFFY
jgi:glycine/D-amino acid oxidase-like deaminating enzyme